MTKQQIMIKKLKKLKGKLVTQEWDVEELQEDQRSIRRRLRKAEKRLEVIVTCCTLIIMALAAYGFHIAFVLK